jgi:hypothetical protein
MSKIPTAEEFLDNYINKYNIPWSQDVEKYYGAINVSMIEFAKLHVEAQQEAILEKAEALNQAKFKGDCNPQIDAESIIKAYPLDNIK